MSDFKRFLCPVLELPLDTSKTIDFIVSFVIEGKLITCLISSEMFGLTFMEVDSMKLLQEFALHCIQLRLSLDLLRIVRD